MHGFMRKSLTFVNYSNFNEIASPKYQVAILKLILDHQELTRLCTPSPNTSIHGVNSEG